MLAGVGLYALVAFAAAGRSREVGIRMALGARSRQVVWTIVREVMLIVGVGLAAGLGLTYVAMRGMSGLFYQVPAGDPLVMLGVTGALGAVAFFATWVRGTSCRARRSRDRVAARLTPVRRMGASYGS